MIENQERKHVEYLKKLSAHLSENRHRMLVVLQGSLLWADKLLTSYINETQSEYKVFGEALPSLTQQPISHYQHHLGSESHIIIFNDEQFHPDAFAALSGTVTAGGFLFWLDDTNAFDSDKNDLFMQRVRNVCQRHQVLKLSQNQAQESQILNTESVTKVIENNLVNGCASPEQVVAVEAITKVATGHRNRPLVLTADRGRGKSSALAIGASLLLEKPKQRIVVSAPNARSLAVFFNQLQQSCPNGKLQKHKFTLADSEVEFVPIDALLRAKHDVNLLLIDEAATIPVYLLTRLIESYHRVVFSSTQHGYEGAGRGFTLKFMQQLKIAAPKFQHLHINQPIRWAEYDPLETFTFDAFLLAGSEQLQDLTSTNIINVKTRLVTPQQLLAEESLLTDVFSLLVNAHYQTSPSDLKLLLNNQAVRILIAEHHGQVVGALLAVIEGGASESEVELARQSKRKLKNQFLPQSLLLHCGYQQAFTHNYLRVMRIAVHPSLHRCGIGKLLIEALAEYAKNSAVDFIGTSFGINVDLLQFWQANSFNVARLGFQYDQASGEHSALMLRALNSVSEEQLCILHHRFYQGFSYYLAGQFNELPPKLVQALYQHSPQIVANPNQQELATVADFINKVRQYDVCAYDLKQWLVWQLIQGTRLNIEVLIARILQQRDVSEICQQFGFTGKKALNDNIIELITQLSSEVDC